MTDRIDLDRELAGYFEARSTSRPPEGLLDRALASVATVRQRPAWRVPERWLPTRRVARVRSAAAALVVVALLVALAVALALFVGAQRRPAPPFGLARPGLIAFDLGGDIYVSNPDGTGRRQLTSGPAVDAGATWSPDGTLLAYASLDPAARTVSVVIVDPDGRHPVVVADDLGAPGDMVWSPDSRHVAFHAKSASGDRLYVADVDPPRARPLGPPSLQGQEPSWSPDGTEIAFKRVGPCCSAQDDTLWLIGVDGSNLHQLTATGGADNALLNTAWAPDGNRLAFLAVGMGARLDVYLINEDGTGRRNLSETPDEDEYWPSWSPDGSRIAYARMEPAFNEGTLVVVAVDGSERTEFSGTKVNSNTPVWSPDGLRVAAYEKNPDTSLDQNDAVAIFDLSHPGPPAIVRADNFSSATWQRLAP